MRLFWLDHMREYEPEQLTEEEWTGLLKALRKHLDANVEIIIRRNADRRTGRRYVARPRRA